MTDSTFKDLTASWGHAQVWNLGQLSAICPSVPGAVNREVNLYFQCLGCLRDCKCHHFLIL